MTKLLSTPRSRTMVAALLAGGLLTSLSACGASRPATSPVSQSQPIAGPPLVACGMAQLSPRVPDRDPVLTRANAFYNQLDQTQLVPPAVQNVYRTDVAGLNPDQQHEVLLLLSSLNECPGLSPQLQQSVLDVFDRLAPQPVDTPDTSGERSSSGGPAVLIRSSALTVEVSSSDHTWWDGEWDGHPWWFRPVWDHPIIDLADWRQWGADRRAGIIWCWEESGWRRIGRPSDTPPDRPWRPVVIGPGTLNHEPAGAAAPSRQPMPEQQSPVSPQGVPSPQSGAGTPQQIQRPNFSNNQPGTTSDNQPGTAGSGVTTSPPGPGVGSQSTTTTTTTTDSGTTPAPDTRSGSTPAPDTRSGSTPAPESRSTPASDADARSTPGSSG